MKAFAIYRLPYQSVCNLVLQEQGEVEELPSIQSLSGRKGFVVAPFCINSHHPLLLIRPDRQATFDADTLLAPDPDVAPLIDDVAQTCHDLPEGVKPYDGKHMHYAIDFANFHSHILDGEFSKIVLARCGREQRTGDVTALQLLHKACRDYPRMFVAMVSAPQCGTWLMATPEMLLEGNGRRWTTMSLAGTMRLSECQMDFDNPPRMDAETMGQRDDRSISWTPKNTQEQRIVSTYITECLERFTSDIEEYGPYTTRAGNLVHLRSDFHFTLPDRQNVGRLLSALYPTPAVCGLPKEASRDFIMANEYAPRDYYSGFVGPLALDDLTHLYVSLRCMRIDSQGYTLFAGGGLLADSDLETEWKETEDKMQTMRQLLKQ